MYSGSKWEHLEVYSRAVRVGDRITLLQMQEWNPALVAPAADSSIDAPFARLIETAARDADNVHRTLDGADRSEFTRAVGLLADRPQLDRDQARQRPGRARRHPGAGGAGRIRSGSPGRLDPGACQEPGTGAGERARE